MRKNQFRAFAGIATLSLCLGLGAAAMPANVKAEDIVWDDTTVSAVSLTPGTNETKLNFAWYSTGNNDAEVKFTTNANDMENAQVFTGSSEDIEGTLDNDKINEGEYYSNKVTVTGLKENTVYYYQVKKGGEWQETETYETKSFSDFSFLYVGDPQIGAGNDTELEAESWNNVLNQAVSNFDVSFMVSAGDQINETNGNSEGEYCGYLGADALTSLPVATTIGNHDSKNPNYSYHFNNPNNFNNAKENGKYTAGKTVAGTDYYYTYGNVLFIVLDTNNYNCATHENVIKRAVNENPDAKWRVVTFHQDIYGSGQDHSDSDGMVLRTQLTPLMDEYDIDVVLQGHDHTYSRTYQLTSDGKEHEAFESGDGDNTNGYFLSENQCYDIKSDVVGGTVENPEGTVYFEANSASGSKYYELISQQQDYIAERNQTRTPTYSVVSVTDDTFSVTTYDYTTGKQLAGSSTYTIKKTEKQDESQQQTSQTQQSTVNNDNNQASATTATSTATATSLKKVKGVKVTNKAGNKVKVKWNTVSGADGYQIQYTYKKGFSTKVKTVNVNNAAKVSKTLKKMKVGKKVYVKVRAFDNVNGQKVFGNFSKVKKLTVR